MPVVMLSVDSKKLQWSICHSSFLSSRALSETAIVATSCTY